MTETIISRFNDPHPVTGIHRALDYYTDDLIVRYRYYRGRVVYIGYEPSGLGRFVVIRYVDKTNMTRFAEMGHFERIFVHVNQLIFKGEKIGKMGQTGYAKGIHCHESLYEPVDIEKHKEPA